MRVYWSGAWYFLAVDSRLRQQSGGKLTLDLALKRLNDCCADQQLSVSQMVTRLDELNAVLLFQPLFEEMKTSEHMPAFETIFASLGVTATDGTVHLQKEGPGALLRRQMTQRKPL
jgi:predicted metalloprotease with PDZ domain